MAVLIVVPTYLVIKQLRHEHEFKEYYQIIEGENLPEIFQQSTLFLNEEDISCQKPLNLYGRVDQVFKTPDGTLILLDTKTRPNHQLHSDDILQLSVYAMILKNGNYGHPVHNFGFIRTVVKKEPYQRTVKYFYVKLYSENEILEIQRLNQQKKEEENNHA
ncbi:PD-(D/E)XK nuclease family protein [Oligella sp. MSHR50489EDL]|uniref:PD-(D/E)XK nuclease family protein n=1 Tax=Oligella sp. MSHR50489EDL TaxID=3139409 RepID=UPI003D817D58